MSSFNRSNGTSMFKILGVDPGSACTGYGLISSDGNNFVYVASGAIVLPRKSTRFEKLKKIQFEILGRATTSFFNIAISYSLIK